MAYSERTSPSESIENKNPNPTSTNETHVQSLKSEYLTTASQLQHLNEILTMAERMAAVKPGERIKLNDAYPTIRKRLDAGEEDLSTIIEKTRANIYGVGMINQKAQIAYLEANTTYLETELMEGRSGDPDILIREGESFDDMERTYRSIVDQKNRAQTLIRLAQGQRISSDFEAYEEEARIQFDERRGRDESTTQIIERTNRQLEFYNKYLATKGDYVRSRLRLKELYTKEDEQVTEQIRDSQILDETALESARNDLETLQ